MSLSTARDKLKTASRIGSASVPRLPDARVLPGGNVVAVSRPSTGDLFRRQVSMLHPERPAKHLMEMAQQSWWSHEDGCTQVQVRPMTAFSISDASGLRISKHRGSFAPLRKQWQQPAAAARVGMAQRLVTEPSGRSEAIRLRALLDSLLEVEDGGWDHQCDVYDEAFSEASLQA